MTKYFFTAEIFLHCSLRVYIPLFFPPQCLQIWSVLNPLLKNISAGVSSGYALPLSSAQKYLFLTKMLKEEEELNLNVNLHLCDTISANLYGVDTLCSKKCPQLQCFVELHSFGLLSVIPTSDTLYLVNTDDMGSVFSNNIISGHQE